MKRKLITFAIVLFIIGGAALFDTIKMHTVKLYVADIAPKPAVADSQKPVTIDVVLKGLDGNPISGHNLFAVAQNGGSFKGYRVKTDEKGNATFIYYPYNVRGYQKVEDAHVRIRDESNSVFIEMYPTIDITIDMVEPSPDSTGDVTTDSFINSN